MLLSFGAECFVLQFAILKYKHQDIQNFNFASCLYGCETWSFILKEEHRLRVFVDRVFRIILAPKRYEVTAEWGKLHSE